MPVSRLISASVGPIVAWTRKRDASVAVGFCTAMTSGGVSPLGRIVVRPPPPPPQAAIDNQDRGRNGAAREAGDTPAVDLEVLNSIHCGAPQRP